MATSKITPEDAQEWLGSLQQVGEGWYRQVALAIKANAHKALKMERREFAQQIGQRMIDPREAIVELHREGHSQTAIGDILGVDGERTVQRVLVEEGLVEPTSKKAITGGSAASGGGKTGGSAADIEGEAEDLDDLVAGLEDEIDSLAAQIKGEREKRKREVQEVKDKLADLRKARTQELRELKAQQKAELTAQERERLEKEAEAWASEQGMKALQGLSHLAVQGIVSDLETATEQLGALVKEGSLSEDAVKLIDASHAAFVDELNVARAVVGSPS